MRNDMSQRWFRDFLREAVDQPATATMPEHLQAMLKEPKKPKLMERQGWLRIADLPSTPSRQTPAHRPAWIPLRQIPRSYPQTCEGTLLKKLSERALTPHQLARMATLKLVDSSFPWVTVGRVFAGTTSDVTNPAWSGTGVLVGHNLLLTASHLEPWDATTRWMRFVPNYTDGNEPFGHAYVTQVYGIRNTTDVDGLDYIIGQLDTPLGDALGWMGSQSFANYDDYRNTFWTSVGYPGSYKNAQEPDLQNYVAVDGTDGDSDGVKIKTPPFTSEGWSGGPLFGSLVFNQGPYVIGICSGDEKDTIFGIVISDNSIFAGGDHMVNLVKYGLANWP